ncbi:hypothetical protein [Streptomyces violascens]|uniref:hypothetical protein n=1 Tax=Streptomyces violascens TaxID=67381 RepID=UPI00369BAAA4
MPYLKKASPGSDSFGHEWPSPDSVVEVTPEEASALLAICDAGFSEVAPPAVDEPEDAPADEPQAEISEAPKPRRGRPPKAKTETAEDQLVEE